MSGVFEEFRKETEEQMLLRNIHSLMLSMDWPVDQAMDALLVAEDKRAYYRSIGKLNSSCPISLTGTYYCKDMG